MPKLARSLNQTVVVSSPAYFGDDEPRWLILVDIEVSGLWFSGEALHAPQDDDVLAPRPVGAAATVFLPFTQIAYLFDPRQFASLPEGVALADRLIRHPVLGSARVPRLVARGDEGDRPSGSRHRPKSSKSRR